MGIIASSFKFFIKIKVEVNFLVAEDNNLEEYGDSTAKFEL